MHMSYIPPSEITFIVVGAICIYLLIIGVVYGRKWIATLGKTLNQPQASLSIAQSPAAPWARGNSFPPLIDKPADHPSEKAQVFSPAEDPALYDQEDQEITLLTEAERAVEEIQEVVNNIESHPANPEEVFTKIRAIVHEYRIFLETEYYDAINSFVAVTVQRDCDLTLTEDDLKSLWPIQMA